ncbi:MAG TPA: hypothetical protein VMN36_02865, partial [Verrucomicrobiales bacterium]|nr:hypothetical protein [Verrucomicrobiales bacterium]
EYGASQALLSLARQLGLHRILYSRAESWVECALAMIVGRIIYQGSKLGLCNQWANTSLWELCGVQGRPDVEQHCYEVLDRLLERQGAIQKKLASKHLAHGCLVFYDITSTYLEGEYEGSELREFYGLAKIVFAGDRGLVTAARLKEMEGIEGLNTISALTHREIVALLERKLVEPELFDERQVVEVIDPDDPRQRYCLCRNPLTAERESKTR